jgi:hypothetical protein
MRRAVTGLTAQRYAAETKPLQRIPEPFQLNKRHRAIKLGLSGAIGTQNCLK